MELSSLYQCQHATVSKETIMTLAKAPKNGRVKTQAKTLPTVTPEGTVKAKATLSRSPKLAKSEHLVAWVAVEGRSLSTLTDLAIKELQGLEKSVTAKRVHKTRVALRRWSALWKLLRDDGWETEKFHTKVNKLLRKLLQALGNARDADINLELGKEIKISNQLSKEWKANRISKRKELEECVRDLRISKLQKRMTKFSKSAPKVVSSAMKNSLTVNEDAENHFHPALEGQERVAQKLIDDAASPEDYHLLRLALKQWRYILTDVYGAVQNELEIAQAQLGELHDCDRIKELLINSRDEVESLGNLNRMRQLLIAQVVDIASTLPFGYRPKVKI